MTPDADQPLAQEGTGVDAPSAPAEAMASGRNTLDGMSHNTGPAPWLVPRSEVSGLEWTVGGTAEPGADALTASLAALDLIKARLARIENCRRYLLHLLEMINEIVLNLKEDDRLFAYTGEPQNTFNFALYSGIAESAQTTQATGPMASFYVPSHSKPSAQRTGLNLYRSKSLSALAARADGSPPEPKKKKRTQKEKLRIKDFILDIITHPYAYVVLFIVVVMSIFFQRRMQ